MRFNEILFHTCSVYGWISVHIKSVNKWKECTHQVFLLLLFKIKNLFKHKFQLRYMKKCHDNTNDVYMSEWVSDKRKRKLVLVFVICVDALEMSCDTDIVYVCCQRDVKAHQIWKKHFIITFCYFKWNSFAWQTNKERV